MDAVWFVRTKAVNFDPSLREARPLVEANLRDIDTETAYHVVSSIDLDEMNSQEEVESQSNGYNFVREGKKQ